MRISIVAVGTRGDVEPHAALCQGFLHAGYQARLCAPNDFTSAITDKHIPFDPLPVSFREICCSGGGSGLLGTGSNGVRFLRDMKEVAREVGTRIIRGISQACEDADAVCYSPMGLPAFYFAREKGIPAFSTSLQPLGRTGSHSNPLLLLPSWMPAAVNRFSFRLAEQLFWQVARPLLQPHVRNRLPARGPFRELYRHDSPALFGYSPLVMPQPGDWKPWMHATGYWTNGSAAWEPPPGLEDFLAGGRAICIGFGSMHHSRIPKILETARQVLARTGRRAVLLTGWSGCDLKGSSGYDLGDGSGWSAAQPRRDGDLFVMEAAPHGWLFPRVSAVIHHGGAGTCAAALRAGVPSVILPFFFDQGFWGQRLAARGLGPAPIPFRRLSPDALSRALDTAEGASGIHSRLRDLSAELRQENGVARAVSIIGRALDRRNAGLRR